MLLNDINDRKFTIFFALPVFFLVPYIGIDHEEFGNILNKQ